VFSVWSTPRNNRGAVFSVRGQCREDIREYGNGTSLKFLSSKGTTVGPEKELEDLVSDATCAVLYRYWECVIK
jgi:hypothetical protein